MIISDLITISGFVIFGIAIITMLRKMYYDLKRERMVKNFISYNTLLDFYLERSYEIIHKDNILIYSLEATSLSDEEFISVSKEFLKLSQKMMGPSLLEEFTLFYGDYDTLTFNMMEYFNRKYDDDEIRKSAMDDLMETEPTEVT